MSAYVVFSLQPRYWSKRSCRRHHRRRHHHPRSARGQSAETRSVRDPGRKFGWEMNLLGMRRAAVLRRSDTSAFEVAVRVRPEGKEVAYGRLSELELHGLWVWGVAVHRTGFSRASNVVAQRGSVANPSVRSSGQPSAADAGQLLLRPAVCDGSCFTIPWRRSQRGGSGGRWTGGLCASASAHGTRSNSSPSPPNLPTTPLGRRAT